MRIHFPKHHPKGFGDIVAIITKPIAATLDKVIKTDLSNCKGCEKRKEKLNQLIPFK